MSNDEKTTASTAPAENVVLNNKEVEEKEATKQTALENNATTTTVEASSENNGKTAQQVESADGAAKEATTPSAPAAPKPPKPTVHKVPFEKDVVYLYQFSRTKNTPSPSPFCLKVETWLRMAGIKYENVDHKMKFRSAKGQLPFVEINGAEIADSAVIIKELGAHFGSDMDSHLTAEQRSVAHATITMLENHFHWIDVWWRTKNPDAMLQGYKIDLQHMVGSKLPQPLLKFYYRFAFRRRGMKKVRATGIGVHTSEEIIQMGKEDLQVLTDMLGDKPFFFGDQPSILDLVVFSNIAQLAVVDKEVAHPFRDWAFENAKNLIQHFEKIKEKYYPDWQEICDTLDMNSHIPKPVKEEKEPEKAAVAAPAEPAKNAEEDKKEEDKEKVEDEKEKEKETDEKKPATETDEKAK